MKSPEILKQFAGFNKIINGNFDYWQRGTSRTLTPNGSEYVSDRWKHWLSSVTTADIALDTDVPTVEESGSKSSNSYKVTNTSAVTHASQNNLFNYVEQVLEGLNVRTIVGKTVTFSFWVKSSVPGTYSFCLHASTAGDKYIKGITIDSANTWERKTVTVEIPNSVNWIFNNTSSLRFMIWMDIGPAYQTSVNKESWGPHAEWGVDDQVNWCATNGATFQMSQVMLHEGKEAIDSFVYAGGEIDTEFAICQRYFWKIPVNIRMAGSRYGGASGLYHQFPLLFPVEMRIDPSFVNISSAIKTTGGPTANTWNSLDYSVGSWQPNTESIALSASGYKCGATLSSEYNGGTNSTTGGFQTISLGSTCIMGFDAEL